MMRIFKTIGNNENKINYTKIRSTHNTMGTNGPASDF